MVSRALVRVPVPPGPEGPARLLPALAEALAGTGPAIAPVPTVSPTVSNDYVMSLLAALRPDDPAVPLESDDVAAVIATSGSTGTPRGVLLTAHQLTAMTPAIQPGARPQWIAALPVTSMGGINVLVRAIAAGREPIAVPSIGGGGPFTADAFAEAWGRTMYGGLQKWCAERNVESIGHFIEHGAHYLKWGGWAPGNMFQLQKYSAMGGLIMKPNSPAPTMFQNATATKK